MNMQVRQENVQPIVPTSETAAVLSIVARAAADPNVDIDKLERLMQMQERAIARQAQTAFDDAMAAMQPELPSIGERGDAAGRYTFAKWEDIQAQIKPVLQRFGFALTFRTDTVDKVAVTGILSHRAGHREETSITLPTDPSGNKNAVQAVASSVQYGKRYTAGALLNLTSHGEDDDGFAGHAPNPWLVVAEGLQDYPDYLAQREKMLAEYGTAAKVPAAVKQAFAAAKSRTQPRD